MAAYGHKGTRDTWRITAALKEPEARMYLQVLKHLERSKPPGKGVSTTEVLSTIMRDFLKTHGSLA